jgi:4-amino-4-deoxy-L-arabinose transferase-like glycosyltransferase
MSGPPTGRIQSSKTHSRHPPGGLGTSGRGLSFVVFAAHMLVSGRYGYFVDELYYLDCSHHLAWGYVDQPPLIAVITWLVTLGDSLSALHFLPAVAAGLRVLLTGLIARDLGARRFGIALACVCVAMAPIYLGLDSLLTMNVFESLFWMSATLVALKIFNGSSQRLWLLFGTICGVGLLNKHSCFFSDSVQLWACC